MAEVVLFHHVQGLTDGVRSFAEQLRAGGHTVHTPDLFDGERPATIEEGLALARALRARFGVATVFVSGERAAALANTDAAFGYLPKPYTHRDIIAAIEVVAELGKGRARPTHPVPSALELFA